LIFYGLHTLAREVAATGSKKQKKQMKQFSEHFPYLDLKVN